MQVEIFSDVICPWCFIGKRRLEQTLSGPLKDIAHDLQISWHAYQLYPQLPASGMERNEFIRMRFGDRAGMKDAYKRIEAEGDSVGIAFNFSGVKRMPNTRSAHRLIQWTRDTDKQHELVEALFDHHFIQGNDVGDVDVLCEAAQSCGLNGEEARSLLTSERGLEELLADFQFAIDAGITGVPCYVVEREFAIPGAQPVEVLARYFGKAYLRLAELQSNP